MDSKTRAKLRAEASKLEPVAIVGKGGLSDNIIAAINDALEARELVKLTVLKNSEDSAKELSEELAEKTRSEVMTVIGSKIVLYRKSHKDGIKHVLDPVKPEKKKFSKPNQAKKTNFAGEHIEHAPVFGFNAEEKLTGKRPAAAVAKKPVAAKPKPKSAINAKPKSANSISPSQKSASKTLKSKPYRFGNKK